MPVLAQTAYLYPGFAELHQPVTLPQGQWTWFPDKTLAGLLVDGTVRLLGVREERRLWRGSAITFYYEGSGEAQLAYLTRGLSYSIYYDLDVDSGSLVGWARVNNRLEQPLSFDHLTFVAGEVPLEVGGHPIMSKAARAYDKMALEAPVPAPEPVYAGSGGGVFRYELADPPVFEPGLTEIPFVRGRTEPVFTWKYSGGFVRSSWLEFQRGYTFMAPAALAGGLVNLRDGGVLLGQTYMSEHPKGEKVQLWLGRDPEGRAERRFEVLKDERKEKAYRVTTSIRNPRSEPVRVEISERFNAREVVLKLPDGAVRTPQGYSIEFTLAPGESREFMYTATLRY